MKINITLSLVFAAALTACGSGASPETPSAELTPAQQIAQLETNGSLPKLDRSPTVKGPDE
jgi:hypothetical protein